MLTRKSFLGVVLLVGLFFVNQSLSQPQQFRQRESLQSLDEQQEEQEFSPGRMRQMMEQRRQQQLDATDQERKGIGPEDSPRLYGRRRGQGQFGRRPRTGRGIGQGPGQLRGMDFGPGRGMDFGPGRGRGIGAVRGQGPQLDRRPGLDRGRGQRPGQGRGMGYGPGRGRGISAARGQGPQFGRRPGLDHGRGQGPWQGRGMGFGPDRGQGTRLGRNLDLAPPGARISRPLSRRGNINRRQSITDEDIRDFRKKIRERALRW